MVINLLIHVYLWAHLVASNTQFRQFAKGIKMIVTFLAYLYLSVGLLVLGICLSAFAKDTSTPKTDLESWVILAITAVFWPVVVPLALLSLIADHKLNLASAPWTGVLKSDFLES